MKRYLIIVLSLVVYLFACKKEEDIEIVTPSIPDYENPDVWPLYSKFFIGNVDGEDIRWAESDGHRYQYGYAWGSFSSNRILVSSFKKFYLKRNHSPIRENTGITIDFDFDIVPHDDTLGHPLLQSERTIGHGINVYWGESFGFIDEIYDDNKSYRADSGKCKVEPFLFEYGKYRNVLRSIYVEKIDGLFKNKSGDSIVVKGVLGLLPDY